ncbi:solute carrier family 2, facilitated glucose transporter member 8 isoform 3-T3 [Amazona ochrocephala]
MAAEESRSLLGRPAPGPGTRVRNKKLYVAAFAAVLGPLSFGFVLGYSSPVIPELRKIGDPELRLDSDQASWFGSIVTLGAAAGGILGGYLVDKVGRKLTLMLCSVPYVFGFTVIISARNVWMLYLGRMLTGLASGVTSLVVPGLNVSEFKNPSIYRPLLIGVALMFFQQLTGINAVMFYAETIFEDANFKDSRLASVVVGSIQVCFTAVAALIIDKTGRKVLLYVSGTIMALSTALFGLYFKMVLPNPNNSSNPDVWATLNSASPGTESSISWLAVVSLGCFVAGFAIGWGPIPWLVTSEIFPLKARGISSGACVLTNWAMAFLVTKEFNDLIGFLTSYGTFWLFSAFCCLNIAFTAFYVPETKGQTLEQIEAYFRRS